MCFINPGKTLEACIWGFARPEGLRGFEICTTTAASRVWPATTRSYIPSSAVCTPPTTTTTIFEPLSVLALEKKMRDDLTVYMQGQNRHFGAGSVRTRMQRCIGHHQWSSGSMIPAWVSSSLPPVSTALGCRQPRRTHHAPVLA